VVDGAGRLRGVLFRDAMIKTLKERGPAIPVLEVMATDVPTLPMHAKLDKAVRYLMEKPRTVIGVTGADQRLVGLLTVENLGEMMMVHVAQPSVDLGPRHASG
jgi:CBS domain-containing protein